MIFHVRFAGKKILPGPEIFCKHLPHTLCKAAIVTLSTSTQRTETLLFNDDVSLIKQATCILAVEP
jgi:hypothetical protein